MLSATFRGINSGAVNLKILVIFSFSPTALAQKSRSLPALKVLLSFISIRTHSGHPGVVLNSHTLMFVTLYVSVHYNKAAIPFNGLPN